MAAQKLEAEDAEQRQKRLQNILERLDGDGPSETTTSEPRHLSFDFGDRRTFAIEPPTDLLARVRQFLPQIEQSNTELLHRDPQSIDIEHIEQTDERVIQMNLGLGIFEQRRAAAASSGAESGSDTTSDDSDSDPSSESASSSASTGSDSEDDGENVRREIRPLPKRAHPFSIQVLPSGDEGDSPTS